MWVRVLGVLGPAVRLALRLLLAGRRDRCHPGLRADEGRHPRMPLRQGAHPGPARAPGRSRWPAAGPAIRRGGRGPGELLRRAVLSVASRDAGRPPADRGLPPAPASAPGHFGTAWPGDTRAGRVAAGEGAGGTAIPGQPGRLGGQARRSAWSGWVGRCGRGGPVGAWLPNNQARRPPPAADDQARYCASSPVPCSAACSSASSSLDSEVFRTVPPYLLIASTALSGVTFSSTRNSAEVPGWTMSRTCSWNCLSMLVLASLPMRAPIPAPMAMPKTGMKNSGPNRNPQNMPQVAPAPTEWWLVVTW